MSKFSTTIEDNLNVMTDSALYEYIVKNRYHNLIPFNTSRSEVIEYILGDSENKDLEKLVSKDLIKINQIEGILTNVPDNIVKD